jgi:hypothetical protein
MVGAIVLAFCWNLGNATNATERIPRRQQPSRAAEIFADARRHIRRCETSFSQNTRRPVFAKTVPNSLSEMGRQNGNVAPLFAAHARSVCATRRNCFIKRRLVRFARLLRCVHFDAAMHNRSSGTGSQIGFDFGIEQAQHRPVQLMLTSPSL